MRESVCLGIVTVKECACIAINTRDIHLEFFSRENNFKTHNPTNDNIYLRGTTD